MGTLHSKEELKTIVGKKSWLSNDYTLSGVLNYGTGISGFDKYLNGKTLKEIKAVIHITSFPKGLVFKIAKNFSSVAYGLPFIQVEKIMILENSVHSELVFEIVNGEKILFVFNSGDSFKVKDFLTDIHLQYEVQKSNQKSISQPKKTLSDNSTKHALPALFSFIVPGLGQIIKGHFIKTLAIWLTAIFIWFAFLGSVLSGKLGLSIAVYFIPFAIWIWNIYDAYNSNDKWLNSKNREIE